MTSESKRALDARLDELQAIDEIFDNSDEIFDNSDVGNGFRRPCVQFGRKVSWMSVIEKRKFCLINFRSANGHICSCEAFTAVFFNVRILLTSLLSGGENLHHSTNF